MIEARAVCIEGKGDVDVLQLGTLQVRDAGPNEVRVKVAAAGLNRADILQRKGFYPAPPGAPADVPGLEYAGTVEQVGEGVREFSVGDAIMGITGGGAMATHLVAHAREAMRVPAGMPLTEAAAIPEVFLTAFDALFVQANLRPGQLALVHAIGSGVGTAALQLGRLMGAEVYGTSRSEDKLLRCKQYDLEHGLVVSKNEFASALTERSGGRAADVILDTIGAAYFAENIKALATGGRLVLVGMLGGATAEFPMGLLLAKRATVIGTVLRSRPLEEKAALTQSFARDMLNKFVSGALKPVIDTVMPMTEIREAHKRMESNTTFGKIILRW
ncbi:MAG TPA: NAD(P)H-quinone oxidoreductase [Polyangiales bacterium]|nr:NAD(P)H-quinone oxidoreductase [Polyangiales bacterium]